MDNLFLFLNKPEDTLVLAEAALVEAAHVESSSITNTETEPVVSSVVKKKYDQSQYNKKFIEKNRDRINEKIICDVCCGSYSYYNKSKHMKSLKHVKLLNKQNQ
jgi:hypothetical protein